MSRRLWLTTGVVTLAWWLYFATDSLAHGDYWMAIFDLFIAGCVAAMIEHDIRRNR